MGEDVGRTMGKDASMQIKMVHELHSALTDFAKQVHQGIVELIKRMNEVETQETTEDKNNTLVLDHYKPLSVSFFMVVDILLDILN